MRLFISFSALFLSVVLLQLSTGGVGPLDTLSAIVLGFTPAQIGLLGSAHYLGFFVGCWWAPRLMGDIGHSRAFAVFTAMGAIGLLSHVLIIDATAWIFMRIASGLCIAGSYTVIEAWLHAKLTNEVRGRAMGSYRVVDMVGSLGAQLFISVLEPASYVSYNLLALICCAALLPLTLTKTPQPETGQAPRLRPALAWRISPLAAMGAVVAGITAASFRMVGPYYGREVGLEQTQIAWFLAAFVFGGALAQLPVGWLADKYDRRWVLIWISGAAVLSSLATAVLAGNLTMILLLSVVFGFTTFPVFSIASAHANDFAQDTQRVELSAALMFFFATGGIAAPYLSSSLIDRFGPGSLFVMIAMGHVMLISYGLWRMQIRSSADRRTKYIYALRTSFIIERLTRRGDRSKS